jgi:monoamine oxidase
MSKAFAPLLRHGARRGLPTKAGFSRGPGLSRRDALRLGGTGLAAALLAPALTGCANSSRNRQAARPPAAPAKTVIVVGGGFSGLACADTLAHAGWNVIVLEAAGRAGGRVRTDRHFFPGDNVELGGEWIGANHPTWLAYAQEFNLRLEEPGAAPEPQGVGDAASQPAPTQEREPAPAEPAQPPAEGHDQQAQPPADAPKRPDKLETEMETEPRASARHTVGAQGVRTTRVITAAVLQPADAGAAPADAPAAGSPATEPATQPGDGDEPIILDGKLIRGDEADALYAEVDNVLAKLIELARGIDPVRPWTSPNAADLDGRSFLAFIDEQQGLSAGARTLLLTGAESDNGVPADRMSLLAYVAMIAGGGFQDYYEKSELYRLADGNDALATALAQKLGSRIHFNSAVDAIRRTELGVIVRTRGDEIFRGDAVVITTPPSVWDRIELAPPLPKEVTPQMGQNVKLLVTLREPVWQKQGLSPEVTSDGLVGLTWAASSESSRGPVALTLFSGARQAEHLRRLPPTERNAAAFASLAPAYPGLADAVIKERFVDWPGFPLTRASYSFPGPGQVTAFGPLLVDGVTSDGLPPLMFAGEHTSYGFIGYMEGALSSGVRVARTLLGEATQAPAESAPAETAPAPQTAPATEPAAEPTEASQPA